MITLGLVAHLPKSPKCWDYWHVKPRPYLFTKIVLLLLLSLFLWGRRLNSRSHKQGFHHGETSSDFHTLSFNTLRRAFFNEVLPMGVY